MRIKLRVALDGARLVSSMHSQDAETQRDRRRSGCAARGVEWDESTEDARAAERISE